ncbi:MAG: MBL fold metallo-hydrolase [Burkholderiaceae bacterium]|jgi:glyoxylase-like metal-dependent hydrolase (beta-lactamase superfamily II)|nr:MBL fold metallo-hydrolase [Burkholderiaceae bacterium]
MPELHYPFERTLPESGDTLEIMPGIKWLRMPLPFALNHVNLWMIAEGDGWCQIDTGLTWDAIKDIWLKLLKTHKLTRQIVTHYHPDHIGLAGWLEQQLGIELWMTQGEYLGAQAFADGSGNFHVDAMIEMFRYHGMDWKRLDALKLRGNVYRAGFPVIPSTYHRLFDNQVIDIGGNAWRVIAGYGHAMEHASLYCESLGILISGDMLLPSISTNIPVIAANPRGNPLKHFLDSIQRYRELPQNTLVLPSHGRPFVGINTRIDQLEAHHQNRCDVLLAAAAEPRTASELLPFLFDRDITDTHQSMFAMSEAIAHLNYLEEQKRLKRVEENGIARFCAM